jgi:hypothetical protein
MTELFIIVKETNRGIRSIMIPACDNMQLIFFGSIYDSVFLIDSPAPKSRKVEFQWLRLPLTRIGCSKDFLNQAVYF